jgi:arylsulfatase A-like enzyme
MIDVLPTLLDLTGLPRPDVMQGQSLAPLLLGRAGWQPRPVIFDEFAKDQETGELHGLLEMIDGRWGASVWIGPPPVGWMEPRPTAAPMIYDIWADPLALHPINEQRPNLVKKYTTLLEEQWKAHQLLAKQFTPGGQMTLSPAQLERLRTLGYVR